MRLVKAVTVALALSITGVQAIDFKKPEDAVAHRQALMDLVRDNFSQLAPVLKNTGVYDSEKFAIYASRLASLAAWVDDAFEKNIQTNKTGSENRVWDKDSKFKQLVAEFAEHTARLSDVAASGDMDKIQTALKKVSDDCRGCHKTFRN